MPLVRYQNGLLRRDGRLLCLATCFEFHVAGRPFYTAICRKEWHLRSEWELPGPDGCHPLNENLSLLIAQYPDAPPFCSYELHREAHVGFVGRIEIENRFGIPAPPAGQAGCERVGPP